MTICDECGGPTDGITAKCDDCEFGIMRDPEKCKACGSDVTQYLCSWFKCESCGRESGTVGEMREVINMMEKDSDRQDDRILELTSQLATVTEQRDELARNIEVAHQMFHPKGIACVYCGEVASEKDKIQHHEKCPVRLARECLGGEG